MAKRPDGSRNFDEARGRGALALLSARADAYHLVPGGPVPAATGERTSLDDVTRAYGDAVRASGDRFVGLRLGAQRGLEFLGPLASVLRSAPTARAAIEAARRFLMLLVHGQGLHLASEGARSALQTTLPDGLDPLGSGVVLQSTVVVMANVFDAMMGSARLPIGLHFACRPPPASLDVGAVRGSNRTLHFGAPRWAITFPTACLSLRPSFADDARHQRLFADLDAEVRRLDAQRSLLDRVRHAIHVHLAEAPRVASIAKGLGLSTRTLQLHLERHGTSFQTELAQVRLEIARRYIRSTEEPIGVIAARLGFRSVEAFSRFFRGAEGRSPRGYRMDGEEHG